VLEPVRRTKVGNQSGPLVLAHRAGRAAHAGQRVWSGGGHRGAL